METNPVPNPDALDSPIALVELERGSSTMATTDRITTETDSAGPRRTVIIAAASAALVLVVGLATLALVNRNDDTAGPDIDAVLVAYLAQNNGDVETYLATLGPAVASDATRWNDLEVLATLNARTEFVEPCRRVESRRPGETTIQCTVRSTNDLDEPAGIFVTSTEFFSVDPHGKINDRDSVDIGITDRLMFIRAFWRWLNAEHPEAYAQIDPYDDQSLPGFRRDPANALIALEYVAEFVEQSDIYPLEGSP